PEKCCASAAEPPFPQHRIFPSLVTQSKKICAPLAMGCASPSFTFSLISALSLKCLMMRLLISILVAAYLMSVNINLEKALSHREHRVHRENTGLPILAYSPGWRVCTMPQHLESPCSLRLVAGVLRINRIKGAS